MGADEIRAYLSHLAVEHAVTASTQNVALSVLLSLSAAIAPHTERPPQPLATRPQMIYLMELWAMVPMVQVSQRFGLGRSRML